MRYYAVPKTCDIYNYGYSATFGDDVRSEIRNCIDNNKILEFKGETENYKICKADVHGEGWWGKCDPGCDGRMCGQPRAEGGGETSGSTPEDCRPGIVTMVLPRFLQSYILWLAHSS